MKHLFAAGSLVAICMPSIAAESLNWPQFRGPDGNGRTTSSKLPLRWNEEAGEKAVRWKTVVHGKAWSSPVIWGKQLWLTSASEDGRELFVLCIDPKTGKILQDQKLFDVEKPQYCI